MALNFFRRPRPEPTQPLGGRYQILQQLGAGGFGQTFLAQDLHLPEHPLCVVKQLKPQVNSPQEMQIARRLFDTEARVLYQLGHHPQIPALLAHFEEDNEFYLAQELIEGHSLDEEFAPAVPWHDRQVVAFLEDILSVLVFVHGHQVIHRDLKPSNLIRRHADSRIVLIDFGAVKQVSTQLPTAKPGVSHTISIGTQGYMPNEQIAGRPQFSSDVYAVGMMAIQALTGQQPESIQPHPQTAELDWHGLAPRSHPGLVALLDYMVRYDFRARYATAAEALAALQSLSAEVSPLSTSTYVSPATSVRPVTSATQPSQGQDQSQPHSPSMAIPTLAVGGRPYATVGAGGAGRAVGPGIGRTRPLSTPPSARQSQPSRRLALPIGIGTAVLLGLSLFTWRACTSAPSVETAGSQSVPSDPEVPSRAPVASPDASAERTPEPEVVASPQTPTPIASPQPTASPQETPPAPEASEPTAQPEEPPAAEPAPAASEPAAALSPATAETTIATLYSYVSSQNWDSARDLFGGSLAQQFDPNFFKQFQQVTVENLRVTNQTADTVELVGQNTYVYSDGSTQREERTFSVQMQDGQPRIVGSSFVRVTQSRGE